MSELAGQTDGNAGGVEGQQAQAQPPGEQPRAAAQLLSETQVAEWAKDFAQPDKEYIANKAWKAPADVVKSYVNLEKTIGAEKAGRTLLLPKDETDVDGWQQLWGRLGRPEAPEGYELDKKVDKVDPAFAAEASKWFHESGLTTQQAEKLAGKWQEFQQAKLQETYTVAAQQDEKDLSYLKSNLGWGQHFDANVELARRAAKAMGFSDEDLTAINEARGTRAILERFYQAGKLLGEDKVPSGSVGAGGGGSSAEAEMARLRQDPAFMDRYMNGDRDAGKQMDELVERMRQGR